jgi:sulfite reductase beta subunit-like hemoprotein
VPTIRIEDVKAAGIAIDIDALAANGFQSISEEDRYRLKTQGVCAQRHVGKFMLRVRIPGGKARPEALRTVARLADRYGHASLHVTTRAGLEIHHVEIGDVPTIFAQLGEVGLTTKGACGDTIRNVIACAHAGTYAGEVLALAPFVRVLHERIVALSDETNISRKINVALACSPHCDDHVATSDIGFVAVPGSAGAAPAFTVWGAGGLGATPRLALEIQTQLPQEDLVPAFDALVAMGKTYADRSSRAKAKIKLLVDRWGAERFRAVFAEEFARAKAAAGYPVVVATESPGRTDAAPPRAPQAVAQKQPGLYTVPALVPMGELATAAARTLADLAERYGDGVVHLTPDQNAEIQGVPEVQVPEVVAQLQAAGLRSAGRGGIADVVSCVGLDYCPLAVTHSMALGEELALAFEPRREQARYRDFRIHVSGCPHSCAKHQVADIGLSGALVDVDGVRNEGYVLYLGGNARERRLGTVYPRRLARREVAGAVEALLLRYERDGLPGERFSQTVARLGAPALFETLDVAANAGRAQEPARRGTGG